MNKLNNQKGSTLIVVLLMVTIFTVLGLSVVSANLNNAKQASVREGNIQSLDLAEMGIMAINKTLNGLTATSKEEAKEKLDKVATAFSGVQTTIVPDRSYEILIERTYPEENTEQWHITSWGVINSEKRNKLTMTKKITYTTGQPQTPEYDGLQLPYIPVAVHSGENIQAEGKLTINGNVQAKTLTRTNKVGQGDVIVNGTLYHTLPFDSGDCKNCTIREAILVDSFPNRPDFNTIEEQFNSISYQTHSIRSSVGDKNFNESTRITGNYSIANSDKVIFNGNTYINGDLSIRGSVIFNGYLFVNGSIYINRNATAVFSRTAYIKGNLRFTSNSNSEIKVIYNQGVVTKGDILARVKKKGSFIINKQQKAEESSGFKFKTNEDTNISYE